MDSIEKKKKKEQASLYQIVVMNGCDVPTLVGTPQKYSMPKELLLFTLFQGSFLFSTETPVRLQSLILTTTKRNRIPMFWAEPNWMFYWKTYLNRKMVWLVWRMHRIPLNIPCFTSHMQPLPSVSAFDHQLGAIARAKHYSTVISLHERITGVGIPLDFYTLNILLNSFCHLNRVGFGFGVVGGDSQARLWA